MMINSEVDSPRRIRHEDNRNRADGFGIDYNFFTFFLHLRGSRKGYSTPRWWEHSYEVLMDGAGGDRDGSFAVDRRGLPLYQWDIRVKKVPFRFGSHFGNFRPAFAYDAYRSL
jgi:hypothetical protein